MAVEVDRRREESRLVFLGLVVGSLLVSLSVCAIVGWSVYAAELEARQCAQGLCDCDLP